MPCKDWDESERDREERQKLKEKLDRVTSLLCYACSVIEANKLEVSVELKLWHKAHKEQDRRRLEFEKENKKFNKVV